MPKIIKLSQYQHYAQKVYILIDEYDTTFNKAYRNQKYLDNMMQFMRNLFSTALKGNYALEKGY